MLPFVIFLKINKTNFIFFNFYDIIVFTNKKILSKGGKNAKN